VQKRKFLVGVLIAIFAGPAVLTGEIKEAVYSDGKYNVKVSVERTDVLIKPEGEEPSFPGLIEFTGKLILPSHRSRPTEKESAYRAVSALSTDGGKTWKDLPSSSPFSDFENSGLYGYLRDGSFLYMDTFPLEAKHQSDEWGAGGYHVTQRVKNPSFQLRRFSKSGELTDTLHAKVVNLPWQEASYELYGSIVQLENGDLLAPFQCHIQAPKKEDNGKYAYAFSVFIARSTDGGKTFKYEWTFDPMVQGKRIGDEGLVEPDIAVLRNGEILCIMRTGSYSPMYQAWSKDNGKTWSQPVSTGWPGVKPRLRVLKNGVLACSSGRGMYGHPQVTYAMFSIDGTGKVWETPFEFYTGLSDNYTFNMERDGKLYVVYSVLSATKPPYEFENKLPYESIKWTVLNVIKEKSR
jgi:hypothetical protein